MAKSHAISRAVGTGFEQRIFHPRRLLLHGFSDCRMMADALCAHISRGPFSPEEIEEGVTVGDSNQPGLFPGR